MVRQYSQLLQMGELLQTTGEREAAALLKLNPWVLSNRIRPLLRGYTGSALQEALQACVQADMDYKSGLIDPKLAVEKLIVTYSAAR